MNDNLLTGKNLSFGYNSNDYIFSNANFDFKKGKLIYLRGDNGAGKTSFINCITLINRPKKGTLKWMNKTILEDGNLAEDKKEIRHKRSKLFGVIFQDNHFRLIEEMTAMKNIALPRKINKKDISNDYKKIISNSLKQFGMETKKIEHQKIKEFNKGHKQLVAIYRAIIKPTPSIIVADEPWSALSENNKKLVVKIFTDLVRKKKKLVIIITHDDKFKWIPGCTECYEIVKETKEFKKITCNDKKFQESANLTAWIDYKNGKKQVSLEEFKKT
ncbi:putative ABC transporter ATP-binding protein [Candidatus Magnetomoraceae bacterium gMMP-15]